MYKTLLALTFGLLSSVAMAEQMYRWVDNQGVPQFGQQPPEGVTYQRINVRSSPPPGGALREPSPLPDSAVADQDDSPQGPTDAELEARRTAECARLRTDLRTMETNPRLVTTNEAGERVRMGEDQRQRMIAETKSHLEIHCND